MSIKWRRNGRTLKSGDKYSVDDGKLTIKSVSSEDCGIYYCVARDGVSIVTSVGTLAIKDGNYVLLNTTISLFLSSNSSFLIDPVLLH